MVNSCSYPFPKKILGFVVLTIVTLLGCASTPVQPRVIYPNVRFHVGIREINAFNKIAILPFTDAPGVPYSGQTVQGIAIRQFAYAGFNVIERSRIIDIINEQKLSSSGLVEHELIKLGKLLGVRAVVIGEVNQYTSIERQKPTAYIPMYGIIVPLEGKRSVENYVSMTLRIIDVETGQLIYSASGQYDQVVADPPHIAAENILSSIIEKWVSNSFQTQRSKPQQYQQKQTLSAAGETGRDGRFIEYANGTVLDRRTNLMWAAKDNGSDINYANAKSYCENYRGGGYTDWRMPTQDELAGLYAGIGYTPVCAASGDTDKVHLTNLITLSCWWGWASETRGSEAANFSFLTGSGHLQPQSAAATYGYRVLPVRSGK